MASEETQVLYSKRSDSLSSQMSCVDTSREEMQPSHSSRGPLPAAHLTSAMGKTPTHKNKGKKGHKLSHKTARRAKSLSAPADLVFDAYHANQARGRGLARGERCVGSQLTGWGNVM